MTKYFKLKPSFIFISIIVLFILVLINFFNLNDLLNLVLLIRLLLFTGFIFLIINYQEVKKTISKYSWIKNKKTIFTLSNKKEKRFVLILTIFRLPFIFWSKNFDYFHSGEKIIFNLVGSFASGNLNALFDRSQSIMIMIFGVMKLFFRTFAIQSNIPLRILSFFVSTLTLILTLKLAKKITKGDRKVAYFATILLGLNHAYLFFSHLVRPDIFVSFLYTLYFYLLFTLQTNKKKLLIMSIISGLAVSFKGNGLFLVLIHYLYVLKYFIDNNKNKINLSLFKINKNKIYYLTLPFIAYYITTPYAYTSIFKVFNLFGNSIHHFSTGHFGLFATLKPPISKAFDKLSLIFFALSPFYFFGLIEIVKRTIVESKKSLNLLFKEKRFYISELLIISSTTLLFFFYIFEKEVYFYRYYFPLFPIVCIFSAILFKKLLNNKKSFLYSLSIIYFVFNSNFYYYLINNSKLNIDNSFCENSVIYRLSTTRHWQLPVSNKEIKILNSLGDLNQLTTGSCIVIPEHQTSIYGKYLKNKEDYSINDWYPSEFPKENIDIYSKLTKEQNLIPLNNNKNYFFIENNRLNYDLWFVTHPNFYLIKYDV